MLILGAFLGGVGLAIWLFWESRKRNVSVHVHDPDSHDSPYPEHDSQESIDSGWVHVQTPEGIKSRPASWIAQFGWENESLDIVVFDEDGRRRLKTWRESGIALDEPNEDEEIWEEPPIAAMVRGRHYTEWVETVKQLKRDGQYEKALLLLLECQAATSRHEPGRPAPWYFEQSAIIHRKLGDLSAEIAVLEAYKKLSETPSPPLIERLEKAYARRTLQREEHEQSQN